MTERLLRTDKANPQSNDEATATLRVIAQSKNAELVGRGFVEKAVELGLGNYAGLYGRPAATSSGAVVEHWPTLVSSRHIVERVHVNGSVHEIVPTSQFGLHPVEVLPLAFDPPVAPGGGGVRIPLGRVFGARSGDKGGNANVGVWARSDEAYRLALSFPYR